MARPKRVYPNSLSKFTKKHTRKIKMYSGVEITALHLVKETPHYFIGIEAWSTAVSGFKQLKYNFNLEYNIPLLKDEYALKILDRYSWNDWVEKHPGQVDLQEGLSFLKTNFPEKELVYFHELKSLISSYCQGNFVEYKDGVEVERCDFLKESGDYYVNKYNGVVRKEVGDLPKDITDLLEESKREESGSDIWLDKYTIYTDAVNNYLTSKIDLIPSLIKLASHCVICPFIVSTSSVKGMTYEYSADINFVETEDKVYFELERHY